MQLGVDFDNTIVCYDGLFHRVCRERNLIPAEVPVNKSEVRNYLRRVGQEPAWTEMQGYVYGARMSEAEPFPGVLEFFRACHAARLPVCIISHKTRHPYLGEKYDLHEAALAWLKQQGFFDPEGIALPRANVFLELTKETKLQRISQAACTHFIDDLPELLLDTLFPSGVQRMLFDPNGQYEDSARYRRLENWAAAQQALIK